MANTKSAKKRARQSIVKTVRNYKVRSQVKTAVRAARENIDQSVTDSSATVLAAISKLSKAANKGIIHKKNAARKISRLMTRVNKALSSAGMQATAAAASKKPAAKKTAARKS